MNDSARDIILQRLRRALADVPTEPEAMPAPDFRQSQDTGREARLNEFTSRVQHYKVWVERVAKSGVAAAVAARLAHQGVRRLVIPTDLPPEFLPEGFRFLADHALDPGTIAGSDGVVTSCACAIAQTGTIVLDHGIAQGRRILTLLPDYHLCLVPADRILGLVPEAVARTADAVAAGRPLTFVSGPSATSDIELNRVEGVHGPRRLDALIVLDDDDQL